MPKLNLEFVGFKNMNGCITVDGKFAKIKKNKNKTYSCQVETSTDKCEVVIYKPHNYISKNWFWWNLLYFFVSIFGILDVRQDKKCVVMDGKFVIDTKQDTTAIIKRQDFADGGKLANIQTEASVEELSNIQYYDKEARKKHKKMKKFKIAATIVSLILIVVLIVVL